MGIPLRVLILEDRQADARLMVEQLRDAGYDPDWKRVETKADFSDQLNSEVSIILADFALPQFDALQALRVLRLGNLDIPFLVVTGALGDDAAVECLRQGAADYILKDRLARLGDAVKQALERKKGRDDRDRAEIALRKAHDELELRVAERTAELALKVQELQAALDQVKQLSGLLPICSYCKKIRDDKDYWHQVDHYFRERTDARFSHSICPDCYKRVMETEMKEYLDQRKGGASDRAV